MSSRIPSLWPSEIRVDVLTPKVILRAQATELERQTQGLLVAEVEEQVGDGMSILVFDVIAPALDHVRETLFKVESNLPHVYPAHVQAPCYTSPRGTLSNELQTARVASSQEQLMDIIKEVLGSAEAISTVLSLIARSNEARETAPDNPGHRGEWRVGSGE